MRIGIESGAITATIAVIDVILYAAVPGNLYRAPAPLLAKLYANMLLTSLNNRAFLRKVSVPHTMQEESVLARAFTSRLANGGGASEAAVRVEVLTETTVDRDTDYAMKKTYSPVCCCLLHRLMGDTDENSGPCGPKSGPDAA